MVIGHFRDYDKWPWAHFNSVEKQLMEHPSFLVGEFLFITTAMLSFYHAWTTPDQDSKRRLKLVWITTLIGGTVNDYFFMLLPIVDNFWQAQAVIMLTPRMPLYIPCVYITFMYWPNVVAARVFCFTQKDIFAEACLAGLLAGITYAPYDVNGARFLWWTWHDSDPGVKLRWFGVPAGSTLWTITFTASMSFLLRIGADRGFSQLKSLMLGCLAVLLMLVVINPFCAIGSLFGEDRVGMPGPFSLLAAICLMFVVVVHRIRKPCATMSCQQQLLAPERNSVRNGLICYFLMHVFVMATFSPENQISTGTHQLFGPCGATDIDLMGLPRVKYICKEQYPSWYFGFECPEAKGASGRWARVDPEANLEKVDDEILASWYTVCGRRHESWLQWMLLQVVLVSLGVVAYLLALEYSRTTILASAKDQKDARGAVDVKDSSIAKPIGDVIAAKPNLISTSAGKKTRATTPTPRTRLN